ncbi:MAG: DUF6279 family lipoprotein [Pigmentiphaga sp.]|uniref:DUF6279 family lipoprotein n=1 Tax=Pigmentiphaga sp. TaxID=1977564 RepID=UPI0029BC9828|nr:DUF6279 family lipoprotein [Pigmentiphaga sp.]MDX3907047.1 DUF6279 family lipoprotein [Pigmentiphaga sp.]
MMRSVLIVVMLGLLAACSGVRLGYNSADKLLAYRLEDWFGLPEAMREPARERLRRVLAWHRSEELPRYARLLAQAEQRLAESAPLRAAELLDLQQQVSERLLRLGDRVADGFADILVQLGPAQRTRLLARLEEDNEEFREEYLEADPARIRQRRIDRLVDRYAFWLGPLAPSQRDRIEQWVDAGSSDAASWLGRRQERQRVFVGIVDAAIRDRSAPQTAARLRAFFAELDRPAATQVRTRHEDGMHARAQLTADLFNLATAAQRERARERLRALAADFLALSKQRAAS